MSVFWRHLCCAIKQIRAFIREVSTSARLYGYGRFFANTCTYSPALTNEYTHTHTHTHTHTTHTHTPRCSSYDDPSSFKSVSVLSDGSSTGFSPPPSAHAHSLTDGTPPPLPSRDPISPQAAPTLGDGYIKMQSAEKRWVWAGRCDQWVWSRMVNG